MVPRSMPTTLDIGKASGPAGFRASGRLRRADVRPVGLSCGPPDACRFPLDGREQVVDVVAFEHAFAQGARARAARRGLVAGRRGRPTGSRVRSAALRARHASLRSVPPRAVEARAPLSFGERRRCACRAPRRVPRSARTLPRAATPAPSLPRLVGPPASARLRGRAGRRRATRAASACDTRRSGTTSARGWRAARPAARCRSSRDETAGSARGTAARGPRGRDSACAAAPRNEK